MSETTFVQVEIPKDKSELFTKEYIEEYIRSGTAKKFIMKRQHRARVKKAREGRYMTRPPYGYLMDANNRLVVDYESWTPHHVLAVFLTTAKSRLDPLPQGAIPFKIIHKKFRYFNGLDESTADSPYITAMLSRRAYIGEIIYQRKHQGWCEPIIPRFLFELVQEARYVTPTPSARPKNWKADLDRAAGILYENALSDAGKWFDLEVRPTDPQAILDFFRIRIQPIYLYRKKHRKSKKQSKKGGVEWETKRGPLKVISKYSLKVR